MHDADKSGPDQEFGSQMLEAALQTAVGAIVIIDAGGRMRTVNPTTQKLYEFHHAPAFGGRTRARVPWLRGHPGLRLALCSRPLLSH
jgi:PAS domain-containing protein